MPYYPPANFAIANGVSFTPVGDIQSSTVQDAIAELGTEKASAGANTDIVSLGSLTQPLVINGVLTLPNVSRFVIYQSVSQQIAGAQVNNFTKILLQSKSIDKLNEVENQGFRAKHKGSYLLNGGIALEKLPTTPNARTILTVFVNGAEKMRGDDIHFFGEYGGVTVSGVCDLEALDFVELFFFVSVPCNIFAGEAVTRLTGIKIA